MPGTNQTQGIQQLLAAEKRAAEKVGEARIRKAKRVKQAREEAKTEIEAYRVARERSFMEFEARYMGTKEDAEVQIEKDCEIYIKKLERSVDKYKNKLVEDLVGLVVDVTPKLHPNYFVLEAVHKI